MSTKKIGELLRKLRLENQLPLRKVAAIIDIDIAILSKMERGERRLTKPVVQQLAKIYKYDEEDLMVLYLSEKIVYDIGKEDLAIVAFQAAEKNVEYTNYTKLNKKLVVSVLKAFFRIDKRIKKAWIFGSFARGEDNYKSDIDLMVSFDPKRKISLFDFADIAYKLEQQTKRKIDLVEEGSLKPFAFETAKNDLIKIYG